VFGRRRLDSCAEWRNGGDYTSKIMANVDNIIVDTKAEEKLVMVDWQKKKRAVA